MDTPHPLASIEQLTGYELQAIKKTLGRPLLQAMDDDFEEALYAYIWIAEKRNNSTLSHAEVLHRPFGDVMKSFEEANTAPDPTNARSGYS